MSRMPLSYFDRHSSGDTLSRVTNDIDTIAQSLNQSLSQVITSSVTVVGIFIMMLTISVKNDFDCGTCFTTFDVTYYVCYETFTKVF